MPWPLPAPGDISARAAGVYESEFPRIYALRNPGAAPAVVDARSPRSTLAVHARVLEMASWDLYLYQSRLANELMPDTAEDWLSRHGTVWGVPQDQPTPASGNLVALGAGGCTVPAGATLSAPGGALYLVSAATMVPAGSTGTELPVVSASPGSAANLPAATPLTFVSALAGLGSQTLAVDPSGITGGQDLESTDSWRARILARIRQRGGGGTGSDYVQWVGEVLQNAIVSAQQLQLGVVNVVLAVQQANGLGPRLPTAAELATVTAYVTDAMNRKPLGMTVLVTPASAVPVQVALILNPDTVAVANAATTALQLFFAQQTIGGTVYASQLNAALSNADGEVSHVLILPSADVPIGPTQLALLGPITFEAPPA